MTTPTATTAAGNTGGGDATATKRSISTSSSTEQDIREACPLLFASLVNDQIREKRLPPLPREDFGIQEDTVLTDEANISQQIKFIADQLERDARIMKRLAELEPTWDHFKAAVDVMFEDGVVNWGRVVTVMVFGAKLVVRSLTKKELVRRIAEWVVDLVASYCLRWISEAGGWAGILSPNTTIATHVQSYLGKLSDHALVAFFAGFVVGATCTYKVMMVTRK